MANRTQKLSPTNYPSLSQPSKILPKINLTETCFRIRYFDSPKKNASVNEKNM